MHLLMKLPPLLGSPWVFVAHFFCYSKQTMEGRSGLDLDRTFIFTVLQLKHRFWQTIRNSHGKYVDRDVSIHVSVAAKMLLRDTTRVE